MNKIKYIKTEDEQGQLSDNILIEVDAENVDLENGSNVQLEINNINSSIEEVNNRIDSINLGVCEKTINKVTQINAQSTDKQYPSARCIYNLLGDVESLLDELIGEGE